jgi:hypothetical protein
MSQFNRLLVEPNKNRKMSSYSILWVGTISRIQTHFYRYWIELEREKREAKASGFSDIWDAEYKFWKVYIHTIHYTIEQTYSADKKRHKAYSEKRKIRIKETEGTKRPMPIYTVISLFCTTSQMKKRHRGFCFPLLFCSRRRPSTSPLQSESF